MTVLTEGRHRAEFIINYDPSLSMDEVTLLAGDSLVVGEVVGRRELDNVIVSLDPLATDGGETPYGISIAAVAASTSAQKVAILARFAEVDATMIQWPDSNTENDAVLGKAALEAKLIVFR